MVKHLQVSDQRGGQHGQTLTGEWPERWSTWSNTYRWMTRGGQHGQTLTGEWPEVVNVVKHLQVSDQKGGQHGQIYTGEWRERRSVWSKTYGWVTSEVVSMVWDLQVSDQEVPNMVKHIKVNGQRGGQHGQTLTSEWLLRWSTWSDINRWVTSSGWTGSEYGNRFPRLRNRKKTGISNGCTDTVKICHKHTWSMS